MVVEDPSGAKESASIEVEVVLALPQRQWRRTLQLPAGSLLRDALDASGVDQQLADSRWPDFALGVFGRPRRADSALVTGDRIEIYRPLTADPKEARRLRAKKRGR
jgi:putative ubiquitin-RnfH superfamily antitoxin RatB of RatAB toxin-antitoxin module